MNIILASINGNDAIRQLFALLIIGIVLGIIYWLVNAAPFIPELFKKVIGWLILLVGAIIIINFLLSLIGHPLIQI